MNRVAACAFVLICASPLACASGGGSTSPMTQLPNGCNGGAGSTYTLTVDNTATVSQECLGISGGNTKLVWQASKDARYLLIAFKDTNANGHLNNPPADPSCYGATCELAKSKTQYTAHNVVFHYSVVVVLKSGKVVSVDPRLIIQP